MKNILMLLLFLLSGTTTSHAFDAKIEANWAWNGDQVTTTGFKFYLDGEVVQNVTSGTDRTSTWTMDLDNGNHVFSMSAYGSDWESARSPDYNFEFLYVPKQDGIAPTMYIRIN